MKELEINDNINENEDAVSERVEFNVTADMIQEHIRIIKNGSLIISASLTLLLFAVFAFQSLITAIIVGIITFTLTRVVFGKMYKNKAKKLCEELTDSSAVYELKENCIEYSGFECGELVHFRRIKFDSVASVAKTEKLLNFTADGISYIIDVNALPEDSKIEAKLAESNKIRYDSGAKRSGVSKKRNLISPLMLIAIIASIIGVICVVTFDFSENTEWVPFVLLAAPAAYFILFAIAEFKGHKTHIALTVISIICAVFIGVGGILPASFNPIVYIEDEAVALKDEFCEIVDLEMEPTYAIYYKEQVYCDYSKNFIDVENADISMDSEDEDSVESFRDAITKDENWISASSDVYTTFYEKYTRSVYGDLILIYNSTAKEYNCAPSEGGGIYYIACYYASGHTVYIYKFEVK